MRNFTIIFLLLLFAGFFSGAQTATRVVRGTLTDPETGEPMPGVNIVIKGTQQGTVSDMNGDYEIEAPVGSTLVFSFVGYTTKEMVVTPLSGEKPASDTTGQMRKAFRHTMPDDPEKTLSPYFFIKSDDPSVDQMPLKATSAAVNIAGVIADVMVRQVYVNTGKNTLEAVYIFPGSTRAAVYAMSMTIGNRKLTAKIREKEKARQDYEKAKQEGKTATLLEQKRPNVFQMNVANILPGDTITVELKYTELLVPVGGTYEFVYPTVVGPRYSEIPDDTAHAGEQWVKSPYHPEGEEANYSFDLRTTLNSGIAIQKVASSSHAIKVQYERKNRAMIRLDESEHSGGNRDFILRYRLRGGEVESGLLLHPGQDENFFLLMVEPPDAPTLEQIPAREYIFIVDVSGSMQGFPISVSQRLLENLISGLRPTDKFNVMLFESSNAMLHEESVAATKENIRHAILVLNRQQGSGGTRLYPALQRALSYKKEEDFSRTFVVITDGYVTIEKEAFNLVRKSLNDANLFAIGIGSSVNRYLIEGLAHAGMGEPFIVTNEKEAEVMGKKFKEFVERPVLTNIRIDYGDLDVYDVEPVSIPDVFAERPIIVFGKYKDNPSDAIKLTGYSGTRRYTKNIAAGDASTEGNDALRYLWARTRIKYLDDYARYYEDDHYRGSEPTQRQEQITKLGLQYNLLTRYTSFIAVDSLIRNKTGDQEKVTQPLPLPQGVSNMALRGSLSGISLTPDVQSLSELIVTGYGVQRQTCLTSSVTSVKEEDVFTSTTSLNDALSGRVTGVMVNENSGAPGGNTTVRIRGNASVASTNTPLYVVDGIPLDATDHPVSVAGTDAPDRISDLNPNDIESIEVLKSPGVTAIYGSRGANGVILVTTRKTHTGRQEIILTSSFSMERVNRLPDLQDSYAQGRPSAGTLQWRGGDEQETFSWGPSLSTLTYDGSAYDYDRNGRLMPAGANDRTAGAYDRYNVFRTGFTADNHLRISKATEKRKYNISLGHRRQNGTIPGSDYYRTTLKLFYERTLNGKLKLGSAMLLSNAVSDLVQRGNSPSSVLYGLLTTPPSFDNGNGDRGRHALKNSNAYTLPDNVQRSYNGGLTDNPYWSIARNPHKGTVSRIIPSLYADYPIADGLNVKYTVSADLYEDQERSGVNRYSAAAPSGRYTFRTEAYRSLNSELILQGDKSSLLNDRLSVDITLGLNNFFSSRELDRTDGTGLSDPGVFERHNAAWLRDYRVRYGARNTRLISRARLEYQQLLSLDLSGTLENTSTLPGNNNDLRSSSAGLAFIFTELPSYTSTLLSFGKVFASVGQIEKEAPLFLDPNLDAASRGLDASPARVERLEITSAPGLRAEQQVTFETGVSLSLFQNRIDLEGAYHTGRTSDLFVPVFHGTELPMLINGGNIRNSGIELNIDAIVLNRRLRWDIGMNFTRQRSVVKSLSPETERIALAGFSTISSSLIAGQPYGVLYGTRYLRNEEGNMVIGNDGFPLVDPEMGVLGDPNPDWMMGIENTFSYKALTLDFLFDIRKGGMIWNGTSATMDYYGTSAATGKLRETRGYIFPGVTEEGEINTVPVDFASPANEITANRWVRYGRGGVAEDAIEDGSWVRLRQLSLSYRFPQHVAFKMKLRTLSVSFTARNLLLITDYSGIDPETNLTGNTNGRGLDYFNIPNSKSYGVLVKVGL